MGNYFPYRLELPSILAIEDIALFFIVFIVIASLSLISSYFLVYGKVMRRKTRKEDLYKEYPSEKNSQEKHDSKHSIAKKGWTKPSSSEVEGGGGILPPRFTSSEQHDKNDR